VPVPVGESMTRNQRKSSLRKKVHRISAVVQIPRTRSRGQSTIEYLLMVAFGAIFSLQIAKFFNDVFRDGLSGLEKNVQTEMQTGQGFSGTAQ
jgi:hypothetical protein